MPIYEIQVGGKTYEVESATPPTADMIRSLIAPAAPQPQPAAASQPDMIPPSMAAPPRTPVAARGTGLDLRRSRDFAGGVGASIPFAGIETPESGAGMAGRIAGEVAQMAIPVGGAVKLAKAALPSTVRAGAKFQDVMGAAAKVPIDISGPGNAALRIMQLAERGGTMPKAVRDFLKRVTDPEKGPMVYEEARDFASNISRLSADEFNRLTPALKREIGTLRVKLNHSVEQAAKSAGKGDTYRSAMKEYAQASRGRQMVEGAKDAAMRYAIPGGMAYYGMGKLSDLLRELGD